MYKLYGIKVDESFFGPNVASVNNEDNNEPMIEAISEDANSAHELLLAQQQTLMWSEEKYLELAPGMNQKPMNIIFDEYAEELSSTWVNLAMWK